MNLTEKEKMKLDSLRDYLDFKFELTDIPIDDLAICFSSETRAKEINVIPNKVYAVIGDKYLDAILLEHKYNLDSSLTATELDNFRQSQTDNSNHKNIMIKNEFDRYVMVGPREKNITTRAGIDSLSATFEALVYVIYRTHGKKKLLKFINSVYDFGWSIT